MGLETADFIVIGGGIAGASAAYELREMGKVILLEKENLPGYHSTGRSSAIFQKGYNKGDPLINILVTASEDFLHNPPKDFTPHTLLTPRALIHIAAADNQNILDDLHENLSAINVQSDFIDGQAAIRLLPILAADYQTRALREQGTADMDVNALHAGYLHGLKASGGTIITEANVTGLTRKKNHWQVASTKGLFQAPTIVNAAGSWVDQVAQMAGISPINIRPLRRTVIMVTLPEGLSCAQWPLVMNPAEGYYFKPDSGKILMTPGDEQLALPCNIQPEEIDIAYGAHYLEQATNLTVAKIDRSWAGLRNRVADGHPVVGFDPEAEGFFWLAGQGGYGIKTAPAMARISASLISGHGLPQDMLALGLQEEQISIRRLK